MTNDSDWRPTANLEVLRLRAAVLTTIRSFFSERGVLEVETPALSSATVTDVHIQSLACTWRGPGADSGRRLYLQTSPEFAMKRLLAAGSGAIYQIARAFRDGEAGRRHNPEFTLLEWYRPGFDHHRLMDEIDELLVAVLDARPGDRITYAEAFQRHAGIDPHTVSTAELRQPVERLAVGSADDLDRDDLLNLLLARVVEPELGYDRPTFVHDFPSSQAALARVRPGDPALAERFEVFVDGCELGNGFHELTDPVEQRCRFEADLIERQRRGLPLVPVDERLLAAIESGMPDCAGVALGIDRLVMLKAGVDDISHVIAFPIKRA
jgi:lysyl-tRNA synthetase class 2